MTELMRDYDVVRRYGDSHPDAWVDTKVENDPPPVRAVVLFYGDHVSEHEAALRSLMTHPERLEVHRSRWSRAHLASIRDELDEMRTNEPRSILGLGKGLGVVEVRLRADQEPLATQLHRRFDDAVGITLATVPYPSGRPPTAREREMQERPEEVSLAHLEATLVLMPDILRAGEDLRSWVVIRNRGVKTLEFESEQPLIGSLVGAEISRVRRGFVFSVAGTGVSGRLEPGEAMQIGVLLPEFRPQPDLLDRVPPGRYVVRTEVPIFDYPAGSEVLRRRVLDVPPVKLTVVIRPEPPSSPSN
jgi:hypothetical protein